MGKKLLGETNEKLKGTLTVFLMFDIVKCFFFTPFSSLWTMALVGSATPYLSCTALSVSKVKLSFTLWSSPLKAPLTAQLTKTWTTETLKWVTFRWTPLRVKWGKVREWRSPIISLCDSQRLAHTHLLHPESRLHPGHFPHHCFEVQTLPYAQHSLMNHLTQQHTHSSTTPPHTKL